MTTQVIIITMLMVSSSWLILININLMITNSRLKGKIKAAESIMDLQSKMITTMCDLRIEEIEEAEKHLNKAEENQKERKKVVDEIV